MNKYEDVFKFLNENRKVSLEYTYTDSLDKEFFEVRRVKEFEGEIIIEPTEPGIKDIEIDVGKFNLETGTYEDIGLKFTFYN